MATATSNLHEVSAWLHAAASALDPTDHANANALAKPIRDGIAARAAARSGPEGAWAENVGQYKKQKDAAGLPVGTGLDPDNPRMLDADQMDGEILEARPDGFSLVYGKDADVKVRAQWFSNGSEKSDDGTASSAGKNQARREFWGLTESDADGVLDAARDILAKKLT